MASSEHVLACFSALLQISRRHISSLQPPPVTPASLRCASYHCANTTKDSTTFTKICLHACPRACPPFCIKSIIP
jgi:hypothetical protein